MSFTGTVKERQGAAYRPGDASMRRKHHPDYQILVYMCLLMMLGLVVIYAIGPQRANALQLGINYFSKQSLSLLFAIGAFVVLARVPYAFIRQYARNIVLLGFLASSVLAIAGWAHLPIAQCSLGACRWLIIPSLGTVQPAELLKFGLLVFGAAFLADRVSKGVVNDLEKTIIPFGAILGLIVVFVIGIQEDMGSGLAFIGIAGAMFLIAGLNVRMSALLVGVALLLVALFIIIAPHRIERVLTFINHDTSVEAAQDTGYHIKNAQIAIGSGGLAGVGIGNSVQASGYLPESVNDSVFAIMGEMFGFVGLTVILVLFAALLLRLTGMIDYLPDPWMRLVTAGVFGWLATHVFLNVAAMIGIIPLTGITLPLLSLGGTSMIFIAGALGLVFQFSRYTMHSAVEMKEGQNENFGSRRRVGRTRYAGRRGFTRT